VGTEGFFHRGKTVRGEVLRLSLYEAMPPPVKLTLWCSA